MSDIQFSSILKKNNLECLQNLLFFNENQQKFFKEIELSIEEFGIPEIAMEGEILRIRTGHFGETQSIFAISNDRLIGLIVFTIDKPDNILILHISIDKDYSLGGKFQDSMLTIELVNKVRELARTIKDVKTIRLAYRGNKLKIITFKVR